MTKAKALSVFVVCLLVLVLGQMPLMELAMPFFTMSLGPSFLAENEQAVMNGEADTILPGAVWCDTDGNPIQAHGGQIQWMPVSSAAVCFKVKSVGDI